MLGESSGSNMHIHVSANMSNLKWHHQTVNLARSLAHWQRRPSVIPNMTMEKKIR